MLRPLERGYCKTNFHKRVLLGLAAEKQKRRHPSRNRAFSWWRWGTQPQLHIRNDSGTKRRSTKKVPKMRTIKTS